jgi:hypothetical protein
MHSCPNAFVWTHPILHPTRKVFEFSNLQHSKIARVVQMAITTFDSTSPCQHIRLVCIRGLARKALDSGQGGWVAFWMVWRKSRTLICQNMHLEWTTTYIPSEYYATCDLCSITNDSCIATTSRHIPIVDQNTSIGQSRSPYMALDLIGACKTAKACVLHKSACVDALHVTF